MTRYMARLALLHIVLAALIGVGAAGFAATGAWAQTDGNGGANQTDGNGGAQPPPGEPAGEPGGEGASEPENLENLPEQLRHLGEVIREMAKSAARGARDFTRNAPPREGTASIAPDVDRGNLRSLYGPEGPTERSVRAVLEHRLVVLGNPLLKAGDVKATDEGIVAEIVTAREGALVERFVVDRETGVWRPERTR